MNVYLISTFVAATLPAAKHNFQHRGQLPYMLIKHFQTGPAHLQQPLPAISVSLFFRLSSGVGNMPELPHCCSGNPNPSTHVTFCPPINEDQSQSRGSGLPVRREGGGRGQEQEAHSPARPQKLQSGQSEGVLGVICPDQQCTSHRGHGTSS